MSSVTVRLKPGREKPVLHRHPWVFSGAVERMEGAVGVGAEADVVSHDGAWLARGLAHPEAALTVRLYTWRQDQPLDAAFFADAAERAVAFRDRLFDDAFRERTNAYRLVFSESDGLSGLIVDRYADVLAVQVSAAALAPHLDVILDRLRARTGVGTCVVRADPDAVEREGLRLGDAPSEPAPSCLRIRENGLLFDVNLEGGHKTGFFLDQRDNRARVAAYARGRRVLSGYCYTGALEVCAAAAGAAGITGLDSSADAIAAARRHHELNGTRVPVEYLEADVPEALRRFRDRGESFDLIVLDPPRFVFNRAQVEKGLRAYKDINLLAMKLLTPGGILATFSCSGQVSVGDFSMVIRWAAVDAGRAVRIVERLSQPPDHPVSAVFPESEYLKGLIGVID